MHIFIIHSVATKNKRQDHFKPLLSPSKGQEKGQIGQKELYNKHLTPVKHYRRDHWLYPDNTQTGNPEFLRSCEVRSPTLHLCDVQKSEYEAASPSMLEGNAFYPSLSR
jgi:hypothetical protein